MWLTGIEPQEEVIKVSDRLLFRKPRHEDLQERVLDDHIHFAHAFQRETWFSCIAELRIPAQRPFEVQIGVDRLIGALRLFRLGAVSATRVDLSAQSFSMFANTRIGSGSPSAVRITYELRQVDVPVLDRFLQVIMPALPTPYLSNQEPDSLSTAFDWYADALLATKPVQGTIASAVACLEALFLIDDPRAEITYQLVQRVAALLGRYGWPAIQTRKQLRAAYEVRSRYVHGSVVKPKQRPTHEQLSEMFHATAECARLACLIMVQMTKINKKSQSELLSVLQDSLIDDGSRNQLSAWCSNVEFGHKTKVRD